MDLTYAIRLVIMKLAQSGNDMNVFGRNNYAKKKMEVEIKYRRHKMNGWLQKYSRGSDKAKE